MAKKRSKAADEQNGNGTALGFEQTLWTAGRKIADRVTVVHPVEENRDELTSHSRCFAKKSLGLEKGKETEGND